MTTATDDRVCEAFVRLGDLCIALGEHPLNKHPGCWTHRVDKRWWVAVNGHHEPKPAESEAGCSKGHPFMVPPFNCYVEYNGWPAGFFDPRGGTLAAGEGANEDTFVAALLAATEAAKQGPERGHSA